MRIVQRERTMRERRVHVSAEDMQRARGLVRKDVRWLLRRAFLRDVQRAGRVRDGHDGECGVYVQGEHVRRPQGELRKPSGRVRRYAGLRHMHGVRRLRGRWSEPVRAHGVHAEDLRVSGVQLRLGFGRLRSHAVVRVDVPRFAVVWRGRDSERLRLHPRHVRRARQELRDHLERVRGHTRLRHVHVAGQLQWGRNAERVRVHADDVQRSERQLRRAVQPMRRYVELRIVHGTGHVRRRRHRGRLRLYPHELHGPRSDMRNGAERLRWHADLRAFGLLQSRASRHLSLRRRDVLELVRVGQVRLRAARRCLSMSREARPAAF
jgi:hypothetical protein